MPKKWTRHGMTLTPTHISWIQMRKRVKGTNGELSKRHYKARGITCCKRWESFINFYADMGDRPEGKSLDRIDNNKGYSPGNCRWATPLEQTQNRIPIIKRKLNANNKSGVKGVFWDKSKNAWCVKFNGKYIKQTKNFNKAIKIRREAESEDNNM